MPYVSKFTVDGTEIEVKDTEARKAAGNAQDTANTASDAVNTAQTDIDAIKKLSRVTVSYDEKTEDITITTTTHA